MPLHNNQIGYVKLLSSFELVFMLRIFCRLTSCLYGVFVSVWNKSDMSVKLAYIQKITRSDENNERSNNNKNRASHFRFVTRYVCIKNETRLSWYRGFSLSLFFQSLKKQWHNDATRFEYISSKQRTQKTILPQLSCKRIKKLFFFSCENIPWLSFFLVVSSGNVFLYSANK